MAAPWTPASLFPVAGRLVAGASLCPRIQPGRDQRSRGVVEPGAGRAGASKQGRSAWFHVKIESGTEVASRGTDRAHCDAAGVNGSNRILSHGAPPGRPMPNGCLGSPELVLLRS